MYIYVFVKIVRIIPGKSRRKGYFVALGFNVLAVALLLSGLVLASDGHPIAPLPSLGAILIMFWMGTVYGTQTVIRGIKP